MNHPLIKKILLTFSVLTLTAAATAAGQSKNKQDQFPINIEQAEAKASAHFAAADDNADGLLSADEFARMRPNRPHRSTRFSERKRKGTSTNRDSVDRRAHRPQTQQARDRFAEANAKRAAEHAKMRAAAESEMFKLIDSNADGLLDADEYAAADKPKLRRQARRAAAFSRFDANGDGFLAREELPNPTARLRRFDTNRDGAVSKREMRKGLRARREAENS